MSDTQNTETKVVLIALTLTGLAQFQRRDLTQHGVPVVLQRGQTVLVSEEMAEALTCDDYLNHTSDGDPIPWFTPVKHDAKADFDFTKSDAKPDSNPQIQHDPASLPETKEFINQSTNVPVKQSTQRLARSVSKK